MEINSIAGLEVYVYREKEYKNGNKKMKWLLLDKEIDNDLRIGEIGRFKNSDKNKIIRLDDNTYRFVRFDEVQTHIYEHETKSNIDKIRSEINKNLDFSLKYADDRVMFIESLLEDNQWIYDLISTSKMISKEQKQKKSFLAENQAYDQVIDYLSSYITHAKFKNEEDEEQHKKLQLEKVELEQKDKRKKTADDFQQLNDVIDLIQSFHHKSTKKKIERRSDTETVASLDERESHGDFIYQEEMSTRIKNSKFTYHKEDIPNSYWTKMFSNKRKETIPFYDHENNIKSVDAIEFRKSTLQKMKREVEILHRRLGLNIKNKEERKEYLEILKERIGIESVRKLRKMYTGLKGDYELSKKILTSEINPSIDKHSTVYEINSDTWYTNEDGELVELSKNIVSMADKNTYKGLILNYKDLKDKYKDNQNSNWWALIKDFEEILSKTELTEEERFVLDVIFDGYSQKELRDMYEELDLGNLTSYRLSNMINVIIPNKMLETYLDKTEDWLYTSKIKGTYKKCSKCEEVKLISNSRHFDKNPSSKDGFYSICKKCR